MMDKLPSLAGMHAQQGAVRKPGAAATPEDAARVAKEFEAMFLGQMMQHMFAGVGEDPNFGGGAGERMFRPMMIDSYAKQMAHGKGIGIAAAVERQLLKLQEV